MDPKDRKTEDDWFRQNERKLLEHARIEREQRERERAERESAEERRRKREAHWMKCPKCGHDLKAEDHAGVEIDRCSFCEGIWMDAGELDDLFRKQQSERQGIIRRILGI